MNFKKIMMIVLFFAGGGAIIGYRLYQLLYFVDQENGFYNLPQSDAKWVLAALIVIFIAAMGILVGIDDKFPSKPVSRSYVLGVMTTIYAFVIGKITMDNFSEVTQSEKSALQIIYLVTLLAFAGFLIYYAVCIFSKIHARPAMSVIPVLFAGYRLAYYFLKFFGLAKSSEVVIEILLLVFVALFWHFFGKYISVLKFRKTRKYMLFTGLVASFLCFLSSLPVFISKIAFSGTEVRVMSSELDFNFFTGLFILVYLGVSYFPSRYYKKDKSESKPELNK